MAEFYAALPATTTPPPHSSSQHHAPSVTPDSVLLSVDLSQIGGGGGGAPAAGPGGLRERYAGPQKEPPSQATAAPAPVLVPPQLFPAPQRYRTTPAPLEEEPGCFGACLGPPRNAGPTPCPCWKPTHRVRASHLVVCVIAVVPRANFMAGEASGVPWCGKLGPGRQGGRGRAQPGRRARPLAPAAAAPGPLSPAIPRA